MSNFKTKDTKNKYKTEITSLDDSHTNFINNISKKRNTYEKKLNNINKLKKKLENHDKNNIKNENYLEDRIKILDEIEIIKYNNENNNYSELDYYFKINDILTDYYSLDDKFNDNVPDILDENSSIEKIVLKKCVDKLDILNNISKKNKKNKQKKKKTENISYSKNIFNFIDNSSENSSDKSNEKKVSKSSLFDDYKFILNNKSKKIGDICINCGSNDLSISNSGIYVCNICNEIDKFKPEVDDSNYDESRIKKPKLPYEKKNHFSDWLTHFQARETTNIPIEIIENIQNEINKYKYTEEEIKTISDVKIKKILKKLKYNIYYKNLSFIRAKITGVYPPSFSKNEEIMLKDMFKIIEEPFYKHKPKKRKNFLSYSYILYKFCEKLKYDAKKNKDLDKYKRYSKYTKQLILLKRKNLREQDITWKKICEEIKWDYYPSL
mgnify:FL=1